MAQAKKHLPSKQEALSSILSTTGEERKREREKERKEGRKTQSIQGQ
jgi:hypothetical protein